MIVVGHNDNPRERFYIRDDLGEVEVDSDYITENGDWYAYMGHCRINSDICYYFTLIE